MFIALSLIRQGSNGGHEDQDFLIALEIKFGLVVMFVVVDVVFVVVVVLMAAVVESYQCLLGGC